MYLLEHWIGGTPIGHYQVEKLHKLGYDISDVDEVLTIGHCGEKHLRMKNGITILV